MSPSAVKKDSPCTLTDPCQNIAKALVNVEEGDTISLMRGTYSGRGNRNLVAEVSVHFSAKDGLGSVLLMNNRSTVNDTFLSSKVLSGHRVFSFESLVFSNWTGSILSIQGSSKASTNLLINKCLFKQNQGFFPNKIEKARLGNIF